jgi:hypothetical protein
MARLLLLASLAGPALAGYALACWLAPFGACTRCHDKNPLCQACDGTGRRVRAGRRAWTYMSRLREEGNR